MKDLSILIPSRNEMFLARTIEDILSNIEADTEVIAVLDGEWAEPPIPQHERVTVIHLETSIGQRAATNLACKLSKAKYVMKCDAHCSFDKGFDIKMIEAFKVTGDNVTMVPVMRNLWAFDWKCFHCGWKKYQGPTPEKCGECGKTDRIRRKMLWIGKNNPQSTSFCFDCTPHFQYFEHWKHRPQYEKDKLELGLTETMSLQGSCWMLTREKYWELEVCDEKFGSWGSQGIEVACKTWLSGGRVLVNHKTWYAHMFRTQGGDFGFPYHISGKDQEKAKSYARNLFFDNSWPKQIHPLSWLVEKFWPVKGWTEEDLIKLKANKFRFRDPDLEAKPAESEPPENVGSPGPIESKPPTKLYDGHRNDSQPVNISNEMSKPVLTEALLTIKSGPDQIGSGPIEELSKAEEKLQQEEKLDQGTVYVSKGKESYAYFADINAEAVVTGSDLPSNINEEQEIEKTEITLIPNKVTIIGLGWVGKSIHKLFPNAFIYDPPRYKSRRKANKGGVAFICVPTPAKDEAELDISIVEECVAWCVCPLIVIRSTVNPGTCDYLSKKYNKRIIMQPEYLGETPQHPLFDEKNIPFLVIGGNPEDRRALINLYTTVYNANVKIRQVSAYEAEVIKLTENRAISFKVAQCQELYDVCEKAGIDYYTIRDAVYGDDPRFNLWWTFVFPKKRGFNSKCIPKDVYAWCAWAESLGVDPEITRNLLEVNKKWLTL